MKKKVFLPFIFLFFFSLIFSITPQRILEKNINTLLNGENPSNLKNIFISGTITQYGMTGNCTIISDFSSKFLFQKSFNIFKETFLKNRKKNYYFDGNNIFTDTPEIDSLCNTYFHTLGFEYLKGKYKTISGKELNGNFHVNLSFDDSTNVELIIDEKTYLLKGAILEDPIHNKTFNLIFSNYRKFGSLYLPSEIDSKSTNPFKINIQDITMNNKLDMNYFVLTVNHPNFPKDIKIIPIPYDTVFKYIKVDCIINNSVPLTFLLDLDSPYTIIDKNVAKQLGLFEKGNMNFNFHYPIKSLGFTIATKFSITNISRTNFVLHTADLTQLCTNIQYPIHGILGADFFQGSIIKISTDDNYLYVSKNMIPTKGEKFSFENNLGRVFVKYSTENGDSLFSIDPFTLDTFRFKDNFIMPKQLIMNTFTMGNDYGIPIKRIIAPDFKIGNYTFSAPVCSTIDNFNSIYNLPENVTMVMGISAINKFNITVDYNKNEVYFEKSKIYNSPLPFNYSGLFLIRTANGFYVDKVIRNSLSDRSGIEVGDLITSVNGVDTLKTISFEKFFSSMFTYNDLNFSFDLLRNGTKTKIKLNVKYPFQK